MRNDAFGCDREIIRHFGDTGLEAASRGLSGTNWLFIFQ